MAEVTEKPADLKSTNELDKFDDGLAAGPTEIRLGQALLMSLSDPPEAGEYIDISARLYIKHAGFDQNTPDSPKVPVRQAKIIVAWPLGEQMPKPKSKNGTEVPEVDGQEPLFDDDGDPQGADDDQQDSQDGSQDDGTVIEFTGGPAFSDGTEGDDD
ncbi:Uncharacterised protein [Mycobacteroides abscessus subsp. abscessus]|jgi:hypothetical protein|uniref:hypothetical protein n=1 Tax=Mycobacteroides abscessus TaxID=36809 RepID=UPI0009279229|nr:hypothetical protein [Mycobacteroides abscessus]SII86123.1 Uncharacterised protein [Mycobacteroides abscessus subsp. abscessus]SIK03894.1 Uncharacterised protein [Mycobacteroides abscessus subsp. abscessus]SIK07358.1 Uncharacterised protein [Mycobacteroides abscessus subsp. abscessus]SIM06712.1 Uncharacterised protein [Mycobacteroides abscessus subsp. abscessus]SIN56947.1 Uncharacterised protein [Mycobacteroides abscessus subsp. abscessus]